MLARLASGIGALALMLGAGAVAGASARTAPATAPGAPGDIIWSDFTQRSETGEDAYRALAVTAAGQVCAAGFTAAPGAPADVLVRKYAAGGAVLWRRVWTWPGRSDDAAAAVVRDRRGSFVVAGSSSSSWLLLKYSAGGYLQWVRRGRAEFARCSLTALTVDGSGNVYAAGAATPAGGGSRILVLKYSSGGALRWKKTLASGAGDASASAVTLGGGDLYVAGRSATGPGVSAATLVKYATGGARRWVRMHAGGGAESARATAVGFAGGPVLAGWGAAGSDLPQGFVARYAPDGTLTWVAAYEAAEAAGDRFDALTTMAGGGVCVTGSRWAAGDTQMLTLAFDAAGAPAWEHVAAGATQGLAVCRAGGGVCSTGGTAAALATLVSAAGSPVWERRLTPVGFADFHPLAVRAGGDYLYAAGSASPAGGGSAAMLIRYRP